MRSVYLGCFEQLGVDIQQMCDVDDHEIPDGLPRIDNDNPPESGFRGTQPRQQEQFDRSELPQGCEPVYQNEPPDKPQ